MQQNLSWVGDFLLLFKETDDLPRGRDGSIWHLELETPASRLYLSAPTKNWRGSPFYYWREAEIEYWQIGLVWGEKPISGPHDWQGHFALLAFNSLTQNWHVWTNRLATFHVYYAYQGKCLALGSFSSAVSSFGNHQLDFEALAGFFLFGFFPENQTYFKDVKIIGPSMHIELDQEGNIIQQTRQWQWQRQVDRRRTFDQTVDAFAQIFSNIVNEQVEGRRVAFPISGGLDSRSTVASLRPEFSKKIWSYSYGYTDHSIETEIAEQIARKRNLQFSKFVIKPYLFSKLGIIIDSVEGFQDITQCRQAYITEEIAAHADYVMAAHWGDVWLDDMGLSHEAFPMADEEFLINAHNKFRKDGDWLFQQICQPKLPYLDQDNYIKGVLGREIAIVNSIEEPDFRLKALKTETWSFRWTTASIRMFQPGGFPLLPFYDPRMIDFFCTVPTDFVAKRRLQIEYLKKYSPDLARIKWQVYDANLYWYKFHETLLLPKRFFSKLNRLIQHKPAIERNWEIQLLSKDFRPNVVSSLLNPGSKIHDFVSINKIEDLINTFYSNPSDKQMAYSLAMLLTFSSWLESNYR